MASVSESPLPIHTRNINFRWAHINRRYPLTSSKATSPRVRSEAPTVEGQLGEKMEGKASENSCLHRMNIADQSDILDTMTASRFRPSVGFHCTQNCTLQWQMSDLSHAI